MPAFATHHLFMQDMLQYINTADGDLDTGALAVGAQGPDIFFFGRLLPLLMPGRPLTTVGSALHRARPGDILDAFAEYYAISLRPDIARSYMCGFVLHYALDRTCHPYVYAAQERIIGTHHMHHSSAHNIVEMAMDTCLLWSKLGLDDPFRFDGAAAISSSPDAVAEISRLLAFVVPRVTGRTVSERMVAAAIGDTARFQRILRDRTGALRLICRVAETLLGPFIGYYRFSANIKPKGLEKSLEYANIGNSCWSSPYQPDVQRRDSFFDLYDAALCDARSLLAGFDDVLAGESSGTDVTHNISFLTGIEA